ncbi:NADH-quinone oxidoreductase subunit NuoG [Usitatibacter palustris]|uniref:NADH-quinone oxidoreductase n=1 Tax=Usitatibacter palustris TaxID=2732487 RepID=A0A6M4HB54_9PROT|nr:NADH-quinone oxidoreductase subunit NuoG [Usitatibacter palustris]QJR16078.1 NADH-quinone oxidoreductase chain 3 [Usitatibacter palustris]
MAINLEIDGKAVQVEGGQTVMDAANKLGIFVPHFCYHKKLTIAANCRMCLVQVEKAPKPLPACATPATEGMKVQTHSTQAVDAQKGVMEFLLINHPLDCPICDQGGECQLQDLAVGYGGSASRYQEEKRVVVNKNLGPLISTDMTRCIHCTRCVRFGQEVAGIMELGMAGRGEHAEILAFVGKTVDSEVSGNMIDLCPVGALTSKPFRYTARSWELSRRKSVGAHDSLGSNLVVQVKQDRVMRVLPLENESLNECWISDRDRFAYEGLNAEDRLQRPMVRRASGWAECDWAEALDIAARGLKDAVAKHGPEALGTLLAPNLSVEEFHLAAKLARGLGSDNVDHRVRQSDFRAKPAGAPWLGMPVSDIASLKGVMLVGCTLRKEQPLLSTRLRAAAKKGLEVHVVHVVDDDLLMPVASRRIVKPSTLVDALRDSASRLEGEGRKAIILGHYAQQHPDFAALLATAHEIAGNTGATVGILPEGANSVGAHLAGAVPTKGLDAHAMISTPRKAYILAGLEADLDCAPGAGKALAGAEFVVALAAYRNQAFDHAHVVLPIAPFTETGGTFVNMEGRAQSFNAVVKPLGESRPAWKVLRVLGHMLGLPGFEAETLEAVRAGIAPDLQAWATKGLGNTAPGSISPKGGAGGLERIVEVPIYATDAIVRRSQPLQKTTDAKNASVARMSAATYASLGLGAGDHVKLRQGGGEAILAAAIDAAVPEGCIRAARSIAETASLGEGPLSAERIAMERAAE